MLPDAPAPNTSAVSKALQATHNLLDTVSHDLKKCSNQDLRTCADLRLARSISSRSQATPERSNTRVSILPAAAQRCCKVLPSSCSMLVSYNGKFAIERHCCHLSRSWHMAVSCLPCAASDISFFGHMAPMAVQEPHAGGTKAILNLSTIWTGGNSYELRSEDCWITDLLQLGRCGGSCWGGVCYRDRRRCGPHPSDRASSAAVC